MVVLTLKDRGNGPGIPMSAYGKLSAFDTACISKRGHPQHLALSVTHASPMCQHRVGNFIYDHDIMEYIGQCVKCNAYVLGKD